MKIEVFNVIAPVLLVAGLGFTWERFGPKFNTQMLTSLVLYIGTPCLVFTTLTNSDINPSTIYHMVLAALACLIIFTVLGGATLYILRYPIRAFLPSLIFPNAGNMGLPLCLFAFGDIGLALGIAFFTVVSVGNFTLGIWLASGDMSPSQLLRTPLIWAALAGLAFLSAGLAPPIWIANTTGLISGFTIPAVLLTLGVALGQMQVKNLTRAIAIGAARLILGFSTGLIVTHALDLQAVERGIILLQCSMPVAVYNFLFAQRYNNYPEDVAGSIVISTIISFLSLPLLITFLT